MTRADIMDLANQLTERKGEGIIDTFSLFTFVLQDFCGRNRFWWRKLTTTFALAQGTQTYDLTTVLPYGQNSGTAVDPETAIEEVTRMVIVNSTTLGDVDELTPIFDDEVVMEMLEGTAVQVKPGRYTFTGDWKTLLFDPPKQAYKVRLMGWQMPNPKRDSTNQTVPVVPAWHHKVIVDGLVYKIRASLYGETDVRAQLSKKDYEDGIITAQMRPRFSPNANQQLTTDESQPRSTGPYLYGGIY